MTLTYTVFLDYWIYDWWTPYKFENYYIKIEVFGFNINILRYILYYFANDCRILLTLLLYNLGRGIRTWGK